MRAIRVLGFIAGCIYSGLTGDFMLAFLLYMSLLLLTEYFKCEA